MTPRTHGTAALAALSMLLLAAGPAWAAPQILGLVASNGMPTPLSCADGQCSGLVNSFCLQFARPSPDDGSAYSLLPGGGITILGLRADGSSFRLAGAGLVTLRSRAGFSAVTVSVPESALRKIGAVSASVEVEALTAALPVAVAGDSDPETQADIDQATGALRQLAQSTFEAPGQRSDAARIVTFAIDSLPATGPASRVGRETAWKKTASIAEQAGVDPQALAAASSIYEGCGAASAFAGCLERARQDLMSTLEFEFQSESVVAPEPNAGGS